MIIGTIVKNKMFAAANFVLLFAVCVTVSGSGTSGNETGHEPEMLQGARGFNTSGNETGHDPKVLQGLRGRRGPRGPPGRVIQCGCNTTKVFKNLENLRNQIKSYDESRENHEVQPSCRKIKEIIPDSKSGYYNIRDSYGQQYATFCDMETDGGGWTLVASVHDNNPFETGRCTTGDRWSSEHGNTGQFPRGDGNWVNLNTFGRVTMAAFDDFKSPGFFELQANDMMIWHVPNDTPFRNFSSAAYVKYRTNNGFLSQYGGNLQSLFSNHFPIISRAYAFPGDRGPAIPVVFDKGSAESLRQHVPPAVVGHVDVGYIHFRVISTHRDAFAMCAGFKLRPSALYPGHICLGSTGLNGDNSYCGDTTAYYEGNKAYKTGWTASELLVKTTYLMFYR